MKTHTNGQIGKLHKLHFLKKWKQPHLNYPEKWKVRKAMAQKFFAQCCTAEVEKESISWQLNVLFCCTISPNSLHACNQTQWTTLSKKTSGCRLMLLFLLPLYHWQSSTCIIRSVKMKIQNNQMIQKRSNKINNLELCGNPSFEITMYLLWVFTFRELKTPTGCNSDGTEGQYKTL